MTDRYFEDFRKGERFVSAGLTITAESHEAGADGSFVSGAVSRKGVTIGHRCWLGNNVSILDGVTIGEGAVIGAMYAAGEFFPIKEVLADSRREDIAIVRLDGANFEPLPLLADKPVGSPVAVLSHPDKSFYSLTSGIISRYSLERVSEQSHTRRHTLVITADYAKGSSGAPVFDNCGNVVGLASSTESVYYSEDHGKQENLQQVFKFCVPAGCVLDLIRER